MTGVPRSVRRSARDRLIAALDRANLLTRAIRAKKGLEHSSARLHRLARSPRRRRVARAAAAAGGSFLQSEISGRPVVAVVSPSYRVEEAAARNHDLVTAACEAADIRYFESVSPHVGRKRLGIVGDRADFLAALRSIRATAAVAIGPDTLVRPEWIGTVAMAGRAARRWSGERELCVFEPMVAPDGGTPLGLEAACEVELWDLDTTARGTTELSTRTPNPVAQRLPLRVASASGTGDDLDRVGRLEVDAFTWPLGTQPVPFPVDAVYTWVDDTDPAWQESRSRFDSMDASEDGAGPARFGHSDALRYSLRSLWYYAPYIRNIYIVTDSQRPRWLATGPHVTIVDHRDIFNDPTALPVFNSHAIETQLHHIPGLSEQYLYINDDVFFGRASHWSEYFTPAGTPCFFESLVRIPVAPDTGAPGIDHAGANAQRVLVELFGWASNQKMKHTPHAQLRSIHDELERRLPDVYANTARSRFRSDHDISAASFLHHRYAEAMGRGVSKETESEFIDLRRSDLGQRLDRLVEQRPASFCLNDTDMPADRRRLVETIVRRFLATRFPFPAPWERPSAVTGEPCNDEIAATPISPDG